MDNFDRDLEDLLNMTDSDEDTSSSSSDPCVFESNQPLVLELHKLKKNEAGTDAVAPSAEAKRKRQEKRKRKKSQKQQNKSKDGASDTSSGLSDSVPTVPGETIKEQFYDAYGSYHALPESPQTSPTAALVIAQVHSEHVHDPKIASQTTTSETPAATHREPSTINKPVSNPP